MKRIVLLAFCVIATIQGHCIVNYTFSDTVPSGQTLYFAVLSNGNVQIVAPNYYVSSGGTHYNWDGYDKPTGALVIPDTINHNDTLYEITSIGWCAFMSCDSLSSIVIPNTITKIYNRAFFGCSGLVSAQLGDAIDTIGSEVFYGCTELNSISIPPNVTLVGARAFMDCVGLLTIAIPSNVRYIGPSAFKNCNSLFFVEFSADSCFDMGYNGGVPSYLPVFENCSSLTTLSIGSNVTILPNYAFKNCSNLDTVFLYPATPPNLGIDVFANNATGRVFVLKGCNYDAYYNSQSWNNYRHFLVEPLIEIEVSLSSNHGTASILPLRGRNIRCDSTVVIQANSNIFHFDHWSNGNTSNPDTLHLIGDTSVDAYLIGCTLEMNPNFTNFGEFLSHRKIGERLEEISVIAAPNGYHFDHWSNGSIAHSDTIHLQGDSTITAYFERNNYYLTVVVNDTTLGTISFPYGDSVLYGDTIMVVAIPNEHHHASWSFYDIYSGWGSTRGDTVYRRIWSDEIIYCNFVIDTHTVSVLPNDINRGTVTGGGVFTYGTPCIVQAYPYSGYTFDHWSNGVTDNPYAFPATEDVELQAIFLAPDEMSYTVTAVCDNPIMGSATANGLSSVTVMNGEEVTLAATPNQGYRFLHWQDNDTNSERTVMVISDSIFTAYFETVGGTEGIGSIGDDNIRIYSADGHIVVEGTTDEVYVFDMTGRNVRNEILTAGVYMVKIGARPVQKVVVMR